MKTGLKNAALLRSYSQEMGGVFSTQDIRALFGQDNAVQLHRDLSSLIDSGHLSRFCKGFYTTPGYVPEVLAMLIIPESYLSLGTILAKELMIGSVPTHTLYAIRVGPNRRFVGPGLGEKNENRPGDTDLGPSGIGDGASKNSDRRIADR